MLKNKLEICIKFLMYGIFFVPLIVLPSTFIFPFIVPKILWIRSIIEVMFGCYILLLLINWETYKPKLTPINIVLALFLLSFGISTFVGVDYYHSLWDNYERMLGLFTFFHYVAFYFIATNVLKDLSSWKWAGRVFLLAGFLVMFIGWLQVQNPQLLLNNGSDRVSSTLGNPIYLGGYGMFLMFLAIMLLLKEKNTLWKFFYAAVGLFGFLGIFISGTRGCLLGLAAAAFFALLSYIIVLKDHPKVRYGLLGLLVLLVALISLLYSFKQTDFVKNLPAIGRTVNTSIQDVTGSPRWIAWQIAWQGFVEKPIFGWGPNNYFYVFNTYYNPKSLNFGYGETWFDNAHNIIMNTLAVQGVFGLIVYLAVFVVSIYTLVIAYKNNKISKHFMVIGGSFLVAHLVGNITVFENPTSYLYFMFWLAFINSMIENASLSVVTNANAVSKKIQTVNLPTNQDKIISGSFVGVVGLLVFLFILVFNIQNADANQKNLLAIRSLSEWPAGSSQAIKDALSVSSPHIDDVRANIATPVFNMLSGKWQNVGKDKSNELLDLIVNNLEKNLSLHPLDIRNNLSLSQLYQLQAVVNNNISYMIKSEQILEDALIKSPRRQQIIYSLVGVKMQLNKKDEAIKLSQQAIEDNPKVLESYWRLAYIYKMIGQSELSKSIIQEAQKNGIEFNKNDQVMVDKILEKTSTNSSNKK